MRRLVLVASLVAVGVLPMSQLEATAASPSKQVEQKIDALMDAVCVQAVVFNDHHLRFGTTITPKACREAPHIVFVSSAAFAAPGNATNAAKKCNQLAADAGLPGIYRAWTTGESSPDVDKLFTRSFGPYVLVDGTVVAHDWDDLTDGTLTAPIDLNEKGESTSVEVWTNVAVDGTRLNVTREGTCDSFQSSSSTLTGIFGVSTETGEAWTNSGVDTCDQMKALYCFGQ